MSNQCRKLSVAMIVRDAEDCLAASLDSVRSLADEIVVLDTGSRDSTLRIARQKATRVVSHPWSDDFADARNGALAQTTGDWVLWLDAGETLSADAADALRKFIDHEADEQTAYYLLIRTPAQGANIAGEQVARVRLHPRLEGLKFAGRIRESLQAAISSLGLKTVGLPHTLVRGSREHLPAIRQQRAERNLRLAKLAMEESGVTPFLLNCAGEALQILGDCAGSAKFHREALDQGVPGSSDMLEAYYGLLTALEGEPDGRDAQLQLCMRALEVFPLDAQLLCAIGGYLQSKEHVELASRAYQLSAQHGQVNLEIWHLEGLQEIATNCYALTLQLLGRDEEAVQLLSEQLLANPQARRLRRQLLELHVRHARRDEALQVVNAMPRIGNHDALRNAVQGACLASEGNWVSAKTYLETAQRAGCREPLALRWLTHTYLALGNLDEAAATFDQWAQVDPLSHDLGAARQAVQHAQLARPHRDIRVDGTNQSVVAAPRLGSLPAVPAMAYDGPPGPS
jgi:tetratricopeptide (TPR) repeat protein